jgi:hypothetical protein
LESGAVSAHPQIEHRQREKPLHIDSIILVFMKRLKETWRKVRGQPEKLPKTTAPAEEPLWERDQESLLSGDVELLWQDR